MTLRDKLEKTGKYRVAMTRSDDTFIPLAERVRFARARKASLFISIHADSIPRSEGQARGRLGLYAVRRTPPTPKRRGLPKPKTSPT